MRKVLIVDDDTIIRITLRSLINWEEMGFQIVADAIHGEAALAYLKDHTVDLIISDMKMPVLDGIGLLEAVSRFEVMPKVLVLSGYDDFKLVRDAFRLGACDYLLKPVNPDEVEASIRKAIRQIEAGRRLAELAPVEPEPEADPESDAAEAGENDRNALVMV
ncbi:response regulator, partial [Hungatella effluvii]|uniref:response regulator n=1 Tax=Hungatella effluvii TaxID=1096246 RepID=UPI002A81DA48